LRHPIADKGVILQHLQGSLFRKFREAVMGHVHIDTLKLESEQPQAQERVGKSPEPKDSSANVETSDNGQASERKHQLSYADVVKKSPTKDGVEVIRSNE